jgi:S1-C subfamily serine protease
MIFEPGKRFGEPAVSVYVGATISAEGRGYRTFRVTGVEKDSPAFAAGLRQNDVITAVENRPAQELTLTALMEILNRAAPSSLVVRRGGEALTLTLTPKTLG